MPTPWQMVKGKRQRGRFGWSKQLKALGFKSLRDYLKSEHWHRRRKHFFSTRVKYNAAGEALCSFCEMTGTISVHHIRYTNLGNEPDRDLVALCGTCHKAVHAIEKIERNLVRATFLARNIIRQEMRRRRIASENQR
jgi:hypothetical protein